MKKNTKNYRNKRCVRSLITFCSQLSAGFEHVQTEKLENSEKLYRAYPTRFDLQI